MFWSIVSPGPARVVFTKGKHLNDSTASKTRSMDGVVGSTKRGLERLDNWGNYGRRGEFAEIRKLYFAPKAAVCGDYLPPAGEVWEDQNDRHVVIDVIDAEKTEKQIINLPDHLKHAVTFKYFGRPKLSGISGHQIQEWIDQAARRIME